MQLQEKYTDKIHAISLNIEFDDDGQPSEDLQTKVRSLLSRRGIHCENILCSDQLMTSMQELEIAALPAVLLFDTQGELIRKFDSNFSYESDVFPFVDELIDSGSTSPDKQP